MQKWSAEINIKKGLNANDASEYDLSIYIYVNLASYISMGDLVNRLGAGQDRASGA